MTDDAKVISIADQIACVHRGIFRVGDVAAMKAVLDTLHDVERLRTIEAAARALVDESEEFASDGGWARSAPIDEWSALDDALGPDEPEA